MNKFRFAPGLCLLLAVICTVCEAQNPLTNPSFENGLTGWHSYSFSEPPSGLPGAPQTGCIGSSCPFDIFYPPTTPDGAEVCGLQAAGTTQNGGVCQSFTGPAKLTVYCRAYAEDSEFMEYIDCRIRVGIAPGITVNRYDVPSFTSSQLDFYWKTITIITSDSGPHTLFIEGVQPITDQDFSYSTLWDNVLWHITSPSAPTVTIPGDPNEPPDECVKIEWTTDIPTTSQVEYGFTTAYGQSTPIDNNLTTSHSVIVTGLTPSRLYHFRVKSTGPHCVDYVSDDYTFEMPIKITNVTWQLAENGLDYTISWLTNDTESTSQVVYGETAAYGNQTAIDPTLTNEHHVTVSGLNDNTLYHFKVLSGADGYSTAESDDYTFTTYPAVQTTLGNPGFENQTFGMYPWRQYDLDILGSGPIDGVVGPYPKNGSGMWPEPPGTPLTKAFEGSYFLGAACAGNGFKNGGVMQRVQAAQGELYTLAAWFMTRRVGGDPGDQRMRIGIDPNGGVDPRSLSIVWWHGRSPTNDARWHRGAVSAAAGSKGWVTLFLEIGQQYDLTEHVCALDSASFAPPSLISIGELRNSATTAGARIENTYITHVDDTKYHGFQYIRAYLQDGRKSGIGLLIPPNTLDPPFRLDKMTWVRGTVVLNDMEAMLLVHDYELEYGPFTDDLPKPLLVNQRSLGGSSIIQPPLYAGSGLCNMGMRVKVCGKINKISPEGIPWADSIAYIDDGSMLLDANSESVRGVRVKLKGNDTTPALGDYIEAVGICATELIDPTPSIPSSGDEYSTYTILTSEPQDWRILIPHPQPPQE